MEKVSFFNKEIMFEEPYSAISFIVIYPVLEKFSILNLAFKSVILIFVSVLDKDFWLEVYLTKISK